MWRSAHGRAARRLRCRLECSCVVAQRPIRHKAPIEGTTFGMRIPNAALVISPAYAAKPIRVTLITMLRYLPLALLAFAAPNPDVRFHAKPKLLAPGAVTHDWVSFLGPAHNGTS